MNMVDDLRDGLVQVSFAVIAVLSRVAAEQDLSLTQLRVLGILRDRQPTMAELATYLGLERSGIGHPDPVLSGGSRPSLFALTHRRPRRAC